MVIICTLLGAASPSLRGFFISRKTDDTAARILAVTRLARSRAISEGRVYRLNFDLRQRTVFLTAPGEGGFRQIESSLGVAFRLPDEVEVEVADAYGSRDYLDFFPDGRAEPAMIRVTDVKGGVAEVVCAAPTEAFVVQRPGKD
jgi:hypothetical protein